MISLDLKEYSNEECAICDKRTEERFEVEAFISSHAHELHFY